VVVVCQALHGRFQQGGSIRLRITLKYLSHPIFPRNSAKNHFDYSKHISDLELELWFYAYAVFYNEYPESRAKIEELLAKGVRSPGWNLKGVLETAKTHGHPDFEKLCEFERLITAESDS
jgi:hypothetical protein